MAEEQTNPAGPETSGEAIEAVVETPVVSEKQVSPEQFLKDFNWHNYEEGIEQVDDKNFKNSKN